MARQADRCPVTLSYPAHSQLPWLRDAGASLCLIFLTPSDQSLLQAPQKSHKSASRQRSPQESYGRNGTLRCTCFVCLKVRNTLAYQRSCLRAGTTISHTQFRWVRRSVPRIAGAQVSPRGQGQRAAGAVLVSGSCHWGFSAARGLGRCIWAACRRRACPWRRRGCRRRSGWRRAWGRRRR